MTSNETSWIELIKEHKWKIVVAIICIFAGISYFSLASQSSAPAASNNSPSQAVAIPSATATATGTAKATTAPSSETSAAPTVEAVPVGTEMQVPPATDWNPVANAFATAWANPKAGQEGWLSAIKPTVTSDLYDQFATTDVERMSQLEVARISSEQEDYAGVNARVFFKNTDFTVMIHLTPQPDTTWLVSVVTSS